jgi:hypothetical protein
MRRAAVAVAFAAATAGASAAWADPHAEAVVLFDQGIMDMKAGRLDKACSELQASLDLVKDSGTKGALARCHGLSGRVASAWLLWRELADTAPTAELRADAAAQAARIEPRLPRYTVKLASPRPRLDVQINGKPVAASVPVAVPIDPGPLTVTASGRDGDRVAQPWTRDYTAVEGEIVAIEIPALALREPPRPPLPEPDPGAGLAERRHTRRIVAIVLGGVAVGAAGGATAFGFDARSKYASARRRCGGAIGSCAPDQVAAAQSRVDAARTSALRSTIGFGVAGGLAAAAVIVWATAPSLERRAVTLAPSGERGAFGLVVAGAF